MHEQVLLRGKRVTLRPLRAEDFPQWQEVRTRCEEWLVKWEPRRPPGSADIVLSRSAFAARCRARDRERQLGTAFGFGIFVDARFCGEINLSGVQRGPFQCGSIGYWVDEACAGKGYVPEAVVVILRFAIEDLGLQRLEISIIPRNTPSRRVMEKLGVRNEGVAVGFLEINGVREDHVRFAMVSDDWMERRAGLLAAWVEPVSSPA